MNHSHRNELIEVFSEICRIVPYMRFGQLLALLSERADLPYSNPTIEADDEELLPVAREYLESLKQLPDEYFAEQMRTHRESGQYQVAG